MPGQKALILLFGAGAFVGAGVGLVVGSAWSQSRVEELRVELEDARSDARRAESELDAIAKGARDTSPRSRVRPGGPTAAPPESGAGAAAGREASAALDDVAPPAAVDPDARRARVAELLAAQPVWFERADGAAALSALRELAAMAPEGRDAAMQLALAINADVSGDGALRLSDVAFYTGLSDPGIVSLMDWALMRDDTPPDFRVISAYSLPWTQGPEATLAMFSKVLMTESEANVQRALVANLGRLRHPAAERLLGGILGDANRDPALRAQVAAELALTEDAGLVRVLEIAAESDESPGVRDAARAALVARHPPATGYLVTGTLPESQAAAAGLRAGDVMVSYDGRATRDVDALRSAATAAEGRETVPVVVVRDGKEVTVLVRPGRLGIFGRSVEAEQR